VLLGLAHVVHRDGMLDADFIATRTEGFDAFVDLLSSYTPTTSRRSRASRPPTSSARRTSTPR